MNNSINVKISLKLAIVSVLLGASLSVIANGGFPIPAGITGYIEYRQATGGAVLAQAGTDNLSIEIISTSGQEFSPQAIYNELNMSYAYSIDIPIFDVEIQPNAAIPGDSAIIKFILNGVQLDVLSPLQGNINIGQSGSIMQVDLVVADVGLDTDSDGLPDIWELQFGLNPSDSNDAELDLDGDGHSNYAEYQIGTAPDNEGDFPDLGLCQEQNATKIIISNYSNISMSFNCNAGDSIQIGPDVMIDLGVQINMTAPIIRLLPDVAFLWGSEVHLRGQNKTILDDYVNNVATTGRLELDASSVGHIEISDDIDWFEISLFEGQLVQFDLEGELTSQGTLPDPYLIGIFDSDGILIPGSSNDDTGLSLNSFVLFSVPVTGVYYIAVGSYYIYTGTYSLVAREVEP